jgi:hypothetical protein
MAASSKAASAPRDMRRRGRGGCSEVGTMAGVGHGRIAVAVANDGGRIVAGGTWSALLEPNPRPGLDVARRVVRFSPLAGAFPLARKSPPRTDRLRACSLPHVGMRVHREGIVIPRARCNAQKPERFRIDRAFSRPAVLDDRTGSRAPRRARQALGITRRPASELRCECPPAAHQPRDRRNTHALRAPHCHGTQGSSGSLLVVVHDTCRSKPDLATPTPSAAS